jgi:hypothetical protein
MELAGVRPMCEECRRLESEANRLRASRDNWRASVFWVAILVAGLMAACPPRDTEREASTRAVKKIYQQCQVELQGRISDWEDVCYSIQSSFELSGDVR